MYVNPPTNNFLFTIDWLQKRVFWEYQVVVLIYYLIQGSFEALFRRLFDVETLDVIKRRKVLIIAKRAKKKKKILVFILACFFMNKLVQLGTHFYSNHILNSLLAQVH